MDRYSQIAALVRGIAGTDRPAFGFRLMEVVSVEGDVCTARLGTLEVPGIRLCVIEGGSKRGVLVTPAVGSVVMVADLSCGELRELAVVGVTEVASIDVRIGSTTVRVADGTVELNGGRNGGMVNVGDVVSRLNAIERDVNSLKTVFAGWVPVPQDGGAALKTAVTSWAGQQLTPTVQSDIEDTKVKH